jgi:hypothetical protein
MAQSGVSRREEVTGVKAKLVRLFGSAALLTTLALVLGAFVEKWG